MGYMRSKSAVEAMQLHTTHLANLTSARCLAYEASDGLSAQAMDMDRIS